MERVRYDLLLVINTLTFAVACNSAVWAVSLCVSAHQHRIPFLGIRPSNVPSRGSLEQMQDGKMANRSRRSEQYNIGDDDMKSGAMIVEIL